MSARRIKARSPIREPEPNAMSTRISEGQRPSSTRHAGLVPVVLFLSTAAACGQHTAEQSIRNTQPDAQSVSSAAGDHIPCAPQGAAGFTRVCTIEHDGDTITVRNPAGRSEEHTSELQSLMRISYAVFCLKKKKRKARPLIL